MQGLLTFWSMVGILALVAWRGNKWFAQRNAAHTDSHQGISYKYHEEHSKIGKLVNLLLTFDVPSARHFRVRRESWYDRFGKGIRLAVESEAGEPVFDNMFFLDSDDEALVALLMKDRKVRSALIILMGRIVRHGARLISLDAENGKLSLYMRAFSVDDPARLREECTAFLVPFLQAIRDLPTTAIRAERGARVNPDKARHAALIVFVVGCASAIWITFMSSDRLSDPWSFIRFSAIIGMIAFAILTRWALRHLGRASNRHRAMALWCFFALIGVVCFSFTALRAINIHLDFAAHEAVVVKKAELAIHYRRKVGTTYTIHYHLDTASKYHDEYSSISWFEFRHLREAWLGDNSGPAIVHIHPGLLGFQWKAVDPLPITVAD